MASRGFPMTTASCHRTPTLLLLPATVGALGVAAGCSSGTAQHSQTGGGPGTAAGAATPEHTLPSLTEAGAVATKMTLAP